MEKVKGGHAEIDHLALRAKKVVRRELATAPPGTGGAPDGFTDAGSSSALAGTLRASNTLLINIAISKCVKEYDWERHVGASSDDDMEHVGLKYMGRPLAL